MSTNVVNQPALSKNIKLTDDDKQDIKYLINEAVLRFGTAQEVANRCKVSASTISLITKNQYITQGDDMWLHIGSALGWHTDGWVLVPGTTNTRIIHNMLEDAQRQSMFMAISERAGSGKSAAIEQFVTSDKTKNVHCIECGYKESPKVFLTHLRTIMGLPVARGTFSVGDLLEQIIRAFEMRKGKPLLIIDQANSLPHATLSLLIHIFNRLEDRLGCIMSGTENLQQKIERGVHNKHQGYDEIEDRFGRSYVRLVGFTWNDTKKICSANGIPAEEVQKKIWHECNPVHKSIDTDNGKQTIQIVESGRVIKRKILKYLMLKKLSENPLFDQINKAS